MVMTESDYFFSRPSITCFLFFPKSGCTNDTCTQHEPVLGFFSQMS